MHMSVFVCVAVPRYTYLSNEEEDTCVSYEEEDTCVSYEEDTCVSYEEEDTCVAVPRYTYLCVCRYKHT